MREYQSVILKLKGRSREDEELLTDLLNERSRAGWELDRLEPLGRGTARLLVVFRRDT